MRMGIDNSGSRLFQRMRSGEIGRNRFDAVEVEHQDFQRIGVTLLLGNAPGLHGTVSGRKLAQEGIKLLASLFHHVFLP